MARKVSKANKRSKTRSSRRKMRGGYYSFDGAVGTGAPNYTSHTEVPVTGGRKRKVRKTRRKMRGGNAYGAVSASYQGTGSRGIADFVGTDTKGPYSNGGAAKGAFNYYGAKPL